LVLFICPSPKTQAQNNILNLKTNGYFNDYYSILDFSLVSANYEVEYTRKLGKFHPHVALGRTFFLYLGGFNGVRPKYYINNWISSRRFNPSFGIAYQTSTSDKTEFKLKAELTTAKFFGSHIMRSLDCDVGMPASVSIDFGNTKLLNSGVSLKRQLWHGVNFEIEFQTGYLRNAYKLTEAYENIKVVEYDFLPLTMSVGIGYQF